MTDGFVRYILHKNGKQRTLKNVLVLVLAPWSLLVFALTANLVARMLREGGAHAQYVGIPVVVFGCAIFSIYNVALFFFKWWKLFLKDKAKFGG